MSRRPDGPPTLPQPPPPEGRAYATWVEGRAVVHPWEGARQAAADRLFHAAAQLGLVAFRSPDLAGTEPVRRTWGTRRATREDAVAVIEASLGGATVDELANALYHEAPWSAAHLQAAVNKVRVHLHRLKADGRVVRRYDRNTGVTLWVSAAQAASDATGDSN